MANSWGDRVNKAIPEMKARDLAARDFTPILLLDFLHAGERYKSLGTVQCGVFRMLLHIFLHPLSGEFAVGGAGRGPEYGNAPGPIAGTNRYSADAVDEAHRGYAGCQRCVGGI